ncbi:uncharacterized protein UV8b_02329 [Ustilaginoidea virens]|uniref:Uncharacterized protein n=1 Tax=Ustilaginoidea virens TaxID=1159556 RepID=A0A8E5HMM8_USTVR|nr:uncharacterized protein UV8b_02329 [Ustilaginoidea virens]QUC18088.1 hypothetical protein UV8b_02329 [Ustilaginoidea virens]
MGRSRSAKQPGSRAASSAFVSTWFATRLIVSRDAIPWMNVTRWKLTWPGSGSPEKPVLDSLSEATRQRLQLRVPCPALPCPARDWLVDATQCRDSGLARPRDGRRKLAHAESGQRGADM